MYVQYIKYLSCYCPFKNMKKTKVSLKKDRSHWYFLLIYKLSHIRFLIFYNKTITDYIYTDGINSSFCNCCKLLKVV